jgi:hypothetical protein
MQWYDITLSCVLTTAVIVQLFILIPQVKKQKSLMEFVDTFMKATDLSRLEKYGELMEKQAEAKSVVTIAELQRKLDQEKTNAASMEQRFLEAAKVIVDFYVNMLTPVERLAAVKNKLPLSKEFFAEAFEPYHKTPSPMVITFEVHEAIIRERKARLLQGSTGEWKIPTREEIEAEYVKSIPSFEDAKKQVGL